MAKKQTDGMICPHCKTHISKTALAKALFSGAKNGRKKMLVECEYDCGYVGGVKEMREHIVICPKREYASERGRRIAETKAKAKAEEGRKRRKSVANG